MACQTDENGNYVTNSYGNYILCPEITFYDCENRRWVHRTDCWYHYTEYYEEDTPPSGSPCFGSASITTASIPPYTSSYPFPYPYY